MTSHWPLAFVFQQSSPQSTGPSSGFFLFQLALIFGIIYFFMIRPKVKKEKDHRERVSQLKKGDEVVTAGGIVGKIIHLEDDRITVKSGESRFVVMRDRVADVPSDDRKKEKPA